MVYFIKKYRKHILIFCFVFIIFICSYLYSKNNSVSTSSAKKLTVTKNNKSQNTGETVFVDIKGAVNAPGVYELDSEKRIIDAINLAGGLSEDANTINLNLSKKLTDEMYIVVYTKNEIANYKNENKDSKEIICASNECVCPDERNDACINKNKQNNNQDSDEVTSDVNSKVSINTADKEMLMTLNGIGEAKADAIINYRNENGSFKTIEDIKNVSGIGDAIFEKIKNNITL